MCQKQFSERLCHDKPAVDLGNFQPPAHSRCFSLGRREGSCRCFPGVFASLVPSGSLLWSRGLLSVSELSFLHFFTHEVHGHVPVHLQTWSQALSFCLSVSGPSPSPVSKLGLTLPHPHPQTGSPSEWKGQLTFLFKQITFILFYY